MDLVQQGEEIFERATGQWLLGGKHFVARGHLKPLYSSFAVLWFGGGLIYVGTLVVLSQFIGPEIVAAVQGLTIKPLANAAVLKQAAYVLGGGLLPLSVLMLLYRKAWIEHFVASISFGGAQLQLKLPRAQFLWICVSNILMTIFSLGALSAVAEARLVRFILTHMDATGPMALIDHTH